MKISERITTKRVLSGVLGAAAFLLVVLQIFDDEIVESIQTVIPGADGRKIRYFLRLLILLFKKISAAETVAQNEVAGRPNNILAGFCCDKMPGSGSVLPTYIVQKLPPIGPS